MQLIDLRSDTVSKPTQAMREAMARAEVGDDCYADDPSVNELERRVAQLLGKPAAVFVPSGTMANQLAVATHARPGEALACAPEAHVLVHEDAAPARLSGVQTMPIGDRRGFSAAQLLQRLREESTGWPRVGLVWLENTLGLAGGLVWKFEQLRAIAELAHAERRPIHLDGARLWNAHVATGRSMAELASVADSVSVCLSKGLGCPVGSLLCGELEFVSRARASRHAFGGAMRQSGVLAAAGLHALEHHVDRLRDDHRRARELSHALADLGCWRAIEPETNIALFALPDGPDAEVLCAPLREAGVLCYPNKYDEIRLVVHLGIDDAAITTAIDRIRRVLS
ncbi:Low-specificity L-threonine aldolase [Enhygromyxa salina]|uniref:Low-specificity L-threonine aldolase n=1 Tax=Enhygromyxa salina TaxID=215803 RepID=A0A0C1Z580_9BACT|nr:GntG family PLP-dependent aldolase [Enhygromyxa salina]KIG12764.1 Low-specificity L-threonine aldolase [Enhygromyxa salina]